MECDRGGNVAPLGLCLFNLNDDPGLRPPFALTRSGGLTLGYFVRPRWGQGDLCGPPLETHAPAAGLQGLPGLPERHQRRALRPRPVPPQRLGDDGGPAGAGDRGGAAVSGVSVTVGGVARVAQQPMAKYGLKPRAVLAT